MWRLVREGLRFYGPGMVGTWVLNAVGAIVVFAVLSLLGIVKLGQALSWVAQAAPMSLLGVAAIIGWAALGTDLAEHRLRLHLMLPLPIGQIALAHVLLPSVLLAGGLLVAHVAAALAPAALVAPAPWFSHATLDLTAAHLLLLLQLTLAIKEVIVLHESGLGRSALAGLVLILVVAVQVQTITAPGGVLGTVVVTALAALTAAFTMTLIFRRPQFTR